MAFNKDPLATGNDRDIIEYSQDLENRVEGAFNNFFYKTIKVTERSGNIYIDLPFNVPGTHQQQNEKVFIGSSISQEYDNQASLKNTFTEASVNASVRHGNKVAVHWNFGRGFTTDRHAFIYLSVIKHG